jgi:two-component system phosphate regulon response regulator OmpR
MLAPDPGGGADEQAPRRLPGKLQLGFIFAARGEAEWALRIAPAGQDEAGASKPHGGGIAEQAGQPTIGEDGLSVCRRLRASHDNTPIIMLTAKAEEIDRIVGLEMGADDYLSKPFNPRELLARINAILRRRSVDEHPGAPSQENESIHFGPYVLSLSTRTLLRDDSVIPITTGEFSVLKVFARHPRIPLSRDKLMELARGRDYRAYDRSLDVQISRLRKMLENNPSKPAYIQTVWGLGYVFVPDGQPRGG